MTPEEAPPSLPSGFHYRRVRCRHCQAEIAVNSIDRHEKLCAGANAEQRAQRIKTRIQSREYDQGQTKGRRNDPVQFLECPHCKGTIRDQYLPTHMQQCEQRTPEERIALNVIRERSQRERLMKHDPSTREQQEQAYAETRIKYWQERFSGAPRSKATTDAVEILKNRYGVGQPDRSSGSVHYHNLSNGTETPTMATILNDKPANVGESPREQQPEKEEDWETEVTVVFRLATAALPDFLKAVAEAGWLHALESVRQQAKA